MKKNNLLKLKILFMNIPIVFIGNLKSNEVDYQVNVGMKNLMPDPTSSVILKYKDNSYTGKKGEYNLGVIQPSALTESGKLYANVLTLGKIVSSKPGSTVQSFTVTYRPVAGTCSGALDSGGFCIVESAGWTSKDPLHGVILPNGKVVQVAQLFYDGGIKLLDGYIIHSDGHVTHSINDPGLTINPPAGKTKPIITQSGTLGWE